MRKIIIMLVLAVVMADASRLSDLMARYKRAPESQRYKIMNQIKREIARLNKSRQNAAIRALRSVSNSSHARKSTRHRAKNTRSSHHAGPMNILDGRGGSSGSAHGPGVSGAVGGSAQGTAGAQEAFGGMQEQAGGMMGGISGGFK